MWLLVFYWLVTPALGWC